MSEASFLVSEANIFVREGSKLSAESGILRGLLGPEILVLLYSTKFVLFNVCSGVLSLALMLQKAMLVCKNTTVMELVLFHS